MKSKADHPASSAVITPQAGRRRHLRFAPPENLICTVAGSPARLTVRDVSLGGIAAWSTVPFDVSERYEFRLSVGTLMVVRHGRVVHCQQHGDGWVVGLAFDEHTGGGPAMDDLIDLIATPDSASPVPSRH